MSEKSKYCPRCKSENYITISPVIRDLTYIIELRCLDCKMVWFEKERENYH